MSDRYEIRLAGSGGQGVILAAVIIGEAAALMEQGVTAVQTQAYGPEARGGASKSEVILSRTQIDYPKATRPNLQLILTQQACNEYANDAAQGGTLIVDDTFVTELPNVNAKIYSLPIVRTAREELKREIVTNMVALGSVARVLEVENYVHPESLKKAILNRVPAGTEELNSKAFQAGYDLMKEQL